MIIRIAQVAPLSELFPQAIRGHGAGHLVPHRRSSCGWDTRSRRSPAVTRRRTPSGVPPAPEPYGVMKAAGRHCPITCGCGCSSSRTPRALTSSTYTATTYTPSVATLPLPKRHDLARAAHVPDLQPLLAEFAEVPLVSISQDQRRPIPGPTGRNGLPRCCPMTCTPFRDGGALWPRRQCPTPPVSPFRSDWPSIAVRCVPRSCRSTVRLLRWR